MKIDHGGRNRQRPSHQVLIVDDDVHLAEVLSAYLTECGYTVDTASSGDDALAAVRRARPDVVLLDLHMPGAGGLEALKRILECDASIAVIIVTGSQDSSVVTDALSNGVVGYVPKPMKLEYLDHLIAIQSSRAAGKTDVAVSPRGESRS